MYRRARSLTHDPLPPRAEQQNDQFLSQRRKMRKAVGKKNAHDIGISPSSSPFRWGGVSKKNKCVSADAKQDAQDDKKKKQKKKKNLQPPVRPPYRWYRKQDSRRDCSNGTRLHPPFL
jgi:hypothetical protein